jgi:hypothetical protein
MMRLRTKVIELLEGEGRSQAELLARWIVATSMGPWFVIGGHVGG